MFFKKKIILDVEFSFKIYFLLEGWRNNFLIILTNLNASTYFAYGQMLVEKI
jgi:hypothetical protein